RDGATSCCYQLPLAGVACPTAAYRTLGSTAPRYISLPTNKTLTRLVCSSVPLPHAPLTGLAAPSRALIAAWVSLPNAPVPAGVVDLGPADWGARAPDSSDCGASTTVSQLLPYVPTAGRLPPG